MEDVAARAGVSRALVSLVMRDSPKVSEKSRSAVRRAAEELGYRPNLMARNLASHRTMTLGLVLNDLHNPFFAEITDGIAEAAEAAGYNIVINTGLQSADVEEAAIDTFLQLRVDGLMLVGAEISDDRILALAGDAPLILVARASDSDAVDSVNTDDCMGGRMVVEHLIELGHRRIAHIDGGSGAGAEGRREGYVEAMHDHGLSEHVRIVAGSFTERAGNEGAGELLRDQELPSAIFAANDLTAAGALDRLEDEGLMVPDDVSLVGFDNTALAALHQMGLTTVNQPRQLMGWLATELLIERIEDGRSDAVHRVLDPSLVERRTTSPPKGDR